MKKFGPIHFCQHNQIWCLAGFSNGLMHKDAAAYQHHETKAKIIKIQTLTLLSYKSNDSILSDFVM